MRYYLLLFFFIYILLTMILPRWRVKKRTGAKVFVVPNDDSAQGFIGKIFRLLFLLVLVTLVIYAFLPEYKFCLLPASFMEIKHMQWAGFIILHLSLLIVIIAQNHMHQSWRVGFDEKEKTELVTNGLFRYSRNPIFLGMLLTMVGLFLTLPNALTLLAAVLTYVVLQIQIRLEEAYLTEKQGDMYLQYMKSVKRWL